MITKDLPPLPTLLENDNFEDITINKSSKVQTNDKNEKLLYLTRKHQRKINYSKENLSNNSRINLINDSSTNLASVPNVPILSNKPIIRKTSNLNLNLNGSLDSQYFNSNSKNLTPSQKLRLRRSNRSKISTNENTDIDLSDDELSNDSYVFNVPFSQPLQSINNKEKIIYVDRQSSITTDSTRTSSILSLAYSMDSISSYDDEFELQEKLKISTQLSNSSETEEVEDCNKSISTITTATQPNQLNLDDYNLSQDAKELTLEFNQNDLIHAFEESRQRKNYLTNFKNESKLINSNSHSVKANSKSDKSKYITITRPDYLPPKDDYEKSKHKKEYENLIHKALATQKSKESEKLNKIQKTQKRRELDYTRWINSIMPDYYKKIEMTSTREMWWRGIPSSLRSTVWDIQIGNKLNITAEQTEDIFEKVDTLLRKHQNISELPKTVQNDPIFIKEKLFLDKLNLDLMNTFPDLVRFQEIETFQTLQKIIIGIIIYHDMNFSYYFTGLSNLASILQFHFQDAYKTFQSLINLLERKFLKLLLSYKNQHISDKTKIINELNDYSNSFNKLFNQKLNRLQTHFKIVTLSNIELFIETIPSIFSNILNFNKSCHILDIYLFEGDHLLLRTLLGLLNRINFKLFGNKIDILNVIGERNRFFLNQKNEKGVYKYLDVGYDDEFIDEVRGILKK